MHRIDLSNKDIRVDLINDIDCCEVTKSIKDNIMIEEILLSKKSSKKYNKKEGLYISIVFDDITDSIVKDRVVSILSIELKKILERKNLLGQSCLVVGLGNNYSTPDSLGPKTVKNIITTRHISILNNLDKKYSVVSKIAPGVFADTGIETYDIVKSLVDRTKPDYLIVIDALSSTTLNKVNKVIQITDSGIDPGSGVGNQRKELSRKTLGVDVIAIGAPTVVNLHTIIKDTLDEYDLEKILENKTNNYMVTPKEIDFLIEHLSTTISKAINNVLHNLTK